MAGALALAVFAYPSILLFLYSSPPPLPSISGNIEGQSELVFGFAGPGGKKAGQVRGRSDLVHPPRRSRRPKNYGIPQYAFSRFLS